MNNYNSDKLSPQDICQEVLIEKYAKNGETTAFEIQSRVALALSDIEKESIKSYWKNEFLWAQEHGFIAGGRVNSAAGTGLLATMINCFTQPVGDSIYIEEDGFPGIYDALQKAAETMRRGGGVGYNFSQIRPKNAKVKGTASRASGPISYMRVFDRSCETVESAGSRRGAQMGIVNIEHPDIEEFINAKKTAGELTNFNVSVGMSNKFMQAVLDDTDFELVHKREPSDELIKNGAYKRSDDLWVYKTIKARDIWQQIMLNTYDYAEPGILFLDTINTENNLWYTEYIDATNPCSEIPIPPYGCCCLGSIDLTKFITKPFTKEVVFDFISLQKVTKIAIRMLDNVLDVSTWPLNEQKAEAEAKRRVGLGITGLGDALIMMCIPYDSEDARKVSAMIMEIIRDSAYEASISLAEEKGSFPLLDADRYLESGFAKRLPERIKHGIRTKGIRNSHLLAIAPTGTISLAFADNASNGVEPAFSWSYTRTKRMPDGSKKDYVVEDHAYRLYRELGGDVNNLPSYFRSALEISAQDHALMVKAVAPFIDAAISKTVNVPVDYPFEDFKQLYMQAWQFGLKGISTYRPSGVRGAVLSVTPETKPDAVKPEAKKEIVPEISLSEADKRLVLTGTVEPVMDSLRWPSRPSLPKGTSAWVSNSIEVNDTSFVAVVSDVDNRPFEVWVTGAKPPRGLSSTAKMLSLDMHTEDVTWAQKKLEILKKTNGANITMTDPSTGESVIVPSLVSALARFVQYRYEELGHIKKRPKASPMLEALIAPQEPKTTTDGTMGWIADILNPITGDDFVLMLKELKMPDGTTRPYSVWAAGKYPRAFDGLLKVLSLDMRIIDPAWIGMKLRKLLTYSEPQGDFMAKLPGSPKMVTFPSTEAYIARMMLHRYQMLGILTADGFPVKEMGVIKTETPAALAPDKSGAGSIGEPNYGGEQCPECHVHAVIKKDGCKFCTNCGYVGSCG